MITGKKYLTQTSIIGVQRIFSKILTLLYWILITSIFTLHEIGIIAILALVVSIGEPVTLVRLHTYAEYEISHSLGEKRWDVIHGIIIKTIAISLCIAGAIGMGLFFVAKPVVEFLRISADYIFLIQLTGVAIIVSPLYMLGRAYLSGMIRGNALAIMSFMQPLTLFISGVILFPHFRLIGLPIAWIISSSVAFLTAIFFIRDVFSYSRVSPPVKEIFAFSLPLCGAGVIKFFSNRIDQLLVLGFLGVELLGLYYLILEAVIVLRYLSSTFLTLFFPTMCESLEHGENRAQLVLSRVVKFVFTLVVPLFVFIAIVGFPFFSLIFFEKVAGGQVLFALLCIASVFNTFGIIIEFALLAGGYKNVPLQVAAISLAMKLVTLPPLLTLFTVVEVVGVAYIIEFFVVGVCVFIIFKRRMSFTIPFFPMLKIMFVGGIVAIMLFVISTMFGRLEYLLAELIGSIILYLVCLAVLKTFDGDDFRFLKNVTPKLLHPLISIFERLGNVFVT